MPVLRPVRQSDLEGLYALAALAKTGLTTLPHDREVLRGRIEDSQRSFGLTPEHPGGETYMFVLEDQSDGKVIGTSAVVSKVGGYHPFWTYEIKTHLNVSKTLGVRKEIRYLQLKEDHNGPAEIGTLFLHPQKREGGSGRLLSLGRFSFMNQFRHCFEPAVLAEMRGRIDERGQSVFWEAVGRHFFAMEFQKADHMVMKDKSFIADLMPKHPIYVPLLPRAARRAIGKVHPDTEPALAILKAEGFSFTGEVDIFEAGPVFACELAALRVVREGRVGALGEVSPPRDTSRIFLVSTEGRWKDFRAVACPLSRLSAAEVGLSADAAQALGVKPGDALRYAPLRPSDSQSKGRVS